MRFFNTAGPVSSEKHYILPPLERLNSKEVFALIEQDKYFVLHAPRQTGKTTCLLALMDHLNRTGKYKCLYINAESAQGAREDVKRGIKAILNQIGTGARLHLGDTFVKEIWKDILEQSGEDSALNELLTLWCEENSLPLVLLIDEIDSLVGDTLISVLRQIRTGYPNRLAMMFPKSIILCGVRDVRDYRIHSARDKAIITGGSAFNIKAKSLRLGDFTKQETEMLYQQHTRETGQVFTEETLERVYKLTEGQPWLTNALGYELCFEMQEGRNRAVPITAKMTENAAENIILRRDAHIDQLVDKLREGRVRRVIEPILAGKSFEAGFNIEDVQYVVDLGLIKRKRNGAISLANRIYQEVIPRELSYGVQMGIHQKAAWYLASDGRLDMNKLLLAFQEFFRKHSEHWMERFDYKEAGPQLLLQAFLQRIVNSGGRVEREYGLGMMRTDLLVIWPYNDAVQEVVIELKVRRNEKLETVVKEGLMQTWKYMDRCEAEGGHLVIFDRDKQKSWEEKIFRREKAYQGVEITVWGM